MADISQQQDGTLAQILLKIGEISTQIAVINAKLDVVTSNTADHENRLRAVEQAMPPNLETRVSGLESAKAKIIGAGVTSGMLSGGIATVVYWALSVHH